MNKKTIATLMFERTGYSFDEDEIVCLNPGSAIEVFAAQSGETTVLCNFSSIVNYNVMKVVLTLP